MNTSRATVGIAIIFLAAALSLAGAPQPSEKTAVFVGDPSVPSATEAFRGETKSVPTGNVEDMAY